MCFGIVRQRNKCGCRLSLWINNTCFSPSLYSMSSAILGSSKIIILLVFEHPRQTIGYIFSLMVWLIEALEVLLLMECYENKMEAGSWGTITIWESAQFSRLNYGHSRWHTYSTSKGLNKATMQIDNLEVVRALPDGMLVDVGITVIRRVQWIMRTEGQWLIMYIPREINLVADGLAKLSLEWESRL
ncbi:uncharacterized protein [Gossypium hirsutum]|nr:uncharacterized protein LOC107952014 isoform X2 [Gossypium hirsutum]